MAAPSGAWDGVCRKHGVAMIEVPLTKRRYAAPLHRCPHCTAEFRDAVLKAKACFRHSITRRWNSKQHTLPPVIVPER